MAVLQIIDLNMTDLTGLDKGMTKVKALIITQLPQLKYSKSK